LTVDLMELVKSVQHMLIIYRFSYRSGHNQLPPFIHWLYLQCRLRLLYIITFIWPNINMIIYQPKSKLLKWHLQLLIHVELKKRLCRWFISVTIGFIKLIDWVLMSGRYFPLYTYFVVLVLYSLNKKMTTIIWTSFLLIKISKSFICRPSECILCVIPIQILHCIQCKNCSHFFFLASYLCSTYIMRKSQIVMRCHQTIKHSSRVDRHLNI
jgi:hypothetical protein